MTAGVPYVVIARLSCPVDELVRHLVDIDGSRLVRALGDDAAVVVLRGPDDEAALRALPGVTSVQPDPLEHLH